MSVTSQENPAKKENNGDILRVGIDLGTSRSAVSASNGKRRLVLSYVGWPKDFVAQKMLGKPVFYGAEVLDHRLSLDIVRPLARGFIKVGTERDHDAVKDLIAHLIEMTQGQGDQTVHAVVGVPAEAHETNRRAIRNAVNEHAEKLMIVSEPFSVAYGLGILNNAMVIDIGAGTVDFCIMHGTLPAEEDQRTLFYAGDFVDQRLFELLQEHHPQSNFTLNLARKFKEQYGFVGDPGNKVMVEAPVAGNFTEHDITEEMRRACESIMPPIVETVMDMVGKFDPEYQEKVRNHIILAGGGSQITGIAEYLERALGEFAQCSCKCADDPLFAGSDGSLALAEDMPEEYWEKDIA